MDDKSEIVAYNAGKIRLKSGVTRQSDCPTFTVVNHWHTDFEISKVTRGRMIYCVNGEECELTEGQAIFVNSAQMHYDFWLEECDGEFICDVFHPSIFDSKIAQQYLDNVIGNNAPPYFVLRPDVIGEKQIIELSSEIYDINEEKAFGYELELMGRFYMLLQSLAAHINCRRRAVSVSEAKRLDAMHKMIGYIQKNYSAKMSLNDIAAAGLVCRSGCCEMFRFYLKKTPIEYLNEYRISKSLELLNKADMNMTDIAAACGFGSSSYFAETFRKQMNFSPSDYRGEYGYSVHG